MNNKAIKPLTNQRFLSIGYIQKIVYKISRKNYLIFEKGC